MGPARTGGRSGPAQARTSFTVSESTSTAMRSSAAQRGARRASTASSSACRGRASARSRTTSSGPRSRAAGSPGLDGQIEHRELSADALAAAPANTSGDVKLGSHGWPCAIAHTAGRRMTNSVSEPGSMHDEVGVLGRRPPARCGRRRPGPAGPRHPTAASQSTDENTGSTRRPSGAATVTIDSSCVLSTVEAVRADARRRPSRRRAGSAAAPTGRRRRPRPAPPAPARNAVSAASSAGSAEPSSPACAVGLEAAPLPRDARGVAAA